MKAVLLSVLVSCALAPQAFAQPILLSAISVKPNRSKTVPQKPAATKSWLSQTLRISLPTTATKFKFSKGGKSSEDTVGEYTTSKYTKMLQARFCLVLCLAMWLVT